ncbi:unnamed protein product [Paramecium primaurelia]|uniref:Uncharacterized protein n=1 Tax=Paramecium primaurelia TaxID=5886 RepID=A0A8S1LC76_PARPR|nr:unnamed protein product [Paramecium primaurelia]
MVSSVNGFIAKQKHINNDFLWKKIFINKIIYFQMKLLLLALNLSNEHYNYINLKEKYFVTLFNQVTSRLQQILQTKNDQMLIDYSQYLQKMYLIGLKRIHLHSNCS